MPRTTIGNLGTPACNKQTGKPMRFIKVSLKDSTGAYNKIPAGTVIDQATYDASIQNIDTSVRWYVSPKFYEFDSPKEDNVYKTYGDTTKVFLREGLRTYTGIFSELGADFLCYLKPLECKDEAIYWLTEKNVIQGYSKDETGDVYPIPVSELTTKLGYAKDDDVDNVMFNIDIPITLKDCQLKSIFDSTADFIETNGLIQAEMAASSPSATGYTITMSVYGIAYTDLLATDITGYDETAGATIAVTSITGGAGGAYVVVFTAPTSSNVVRTEETAVLTGKGFSFNSVTETIA